MKEGSFRILHTRGKCEGGREGGRGPEEEGFHNTAMARCLSSIQTNSHNIHLLNFNPGGNAPEGGRGGEGREGKGQYLMSKLSGHRTLV